MAWDRCCFELGLEYSYWIEAVVYRQEKEHDSVLGFAKVGGSAEGGVAGPVIKAVFDIV